MACIERNPNCGIGDSKDTVSEPLSQLGSALGVIGAIITAVIAIFGAKEIAEVVAALGGATGAGAISGALAVIAVIIVIGLFGLNRCQQGRGLPTCVAGVVSNIEESFGDALQEIFPFSGQHTRVDVTVKSFFWNVLEQSNAYVFCTEASFPKRSEIMRSYYYTERVCNAVTGSLIGATAGGIAGIIAGAVVAAAIGCATVILCIFALLLAALIAAGAALAGALAGGQIAKAVSDNNMPTTSSGSSIGIGDLVTVNGNMEQRDYDDKANVLWWAQSTSLHGRVLDGTPQPFSYCEIDDQLMVDGCPRATEEPPKPEPPR
ncbi:MAG: hypothetical protein RM368_28060 [Nostoc sp. DedSLP03]|uniref:hypothetical protein n=1 Tax=Nostoc sp. DedSLP03 TaxID=3075400 RepID=UPI002AD206EF|nr:hypothetical protein [Nostoc sp. DedSLP03]MDZ7968763.1 hypothetical protein [Nostoc sp. DedSLP03]